jgi:hypothetical protein
MLTPPPRDENGAVEPHDHPEIGNDDGVIRRVQEQWIVEDKDAGTVGYRRWHSRRRPVTMPACRLTSKL